MVPLLIEFVQISNFFQPNIVVWVIRWNSEVLKSLESYLLKTGGSTDTSHLIFPNTGDIFIGRIIDHNGENKTRVCGRSKTNKGRYMVFL